MYYTRQMVRKKERSFCLFKTCKSRSTLSSIYINSCSNSAFPGISNSKRANLMLPFWQNCVSHLLPSIWSVLLEYLYRFYAVMYYGVFWRCLFFIFLCCFCLFSLCFSFLAKILSLAVKMQPLRQPLLNWL